jgi:hypothetical protein
VSVIDKHEDKAYGSNDNNSSINLLLNTLAKPFASLYVEMGFFPKLLFYLLWAYSIGALCMFPALFFGWGIIGGFALVALSNCWIYGILRRKEIRQKLANITNHSGWNNSRSMDEVIRELSKTKQI